MRLGRDPPARSLAILMCATGGVVFVGSYSIKNWTNLAADFLGVPVRNRGFGGSTLGDSLHMTRAGYLLWRSLLRPKVHRQ